MAKSTLFDEVLRPLLSTPTPIPARLAYTPEFEAACAKLGKSPSTDEKHLLWERFLELREGRRPSERLADDNLVDDKPINQTQRASPALADDELIFPESLFVEPINSRPSVMPKADFPAIKVSSAKLPSHESDTNSAGIDHNLKRQRLLAEVADSNFGTIDRRLVYLLQKFPETRDSYTALAIKYWKVFESNIIENWNPLELEILFELESIESINRQRRFIQNTLKLFPGMEDIKQYRMVYQEQLQRYLAAHRDTAPEIRFYLDETGNEGDKAYTGVGGICIANWKQYDKHAAALSLWRQNQNWPEPIHFAESGVARLDRAVSLLGQLERRRGGVLFLGYSMNSRGTPANAIYSLFVHLIIDSLRQLDSQKCITEPRMVRVIKEAEPGFDELYLPSMEKSLAELTDLEFEGRIGIEPIETMTKGHHVLLECADLIAGGMQRRALFNKQNPKDRLADAVFNVTGFADIKDEGALYRFFGK